MAEPWQYLQFTVNSTSLRVDDSRAIRVDHAPLMPDDLIIFATGRTAGGPISKGANAGGPITFGAQSGSQRFTGRTR